MTLSSPTQARRYCDYPKSKVEHFVPREDLLDEIGQFFQEDGTTLWGKRVVLHGIGGCGKTQLALEYCERSSKAGIFDAIFWIDATSLATIMQCYVTIAATVFPDEQAIPGHEDVRPILNSIETWGYSTLLVFDNFDGRDLYENHAFHDLVPHGKTGHLLFTSRNTTAMELAHFVPTSQMSEDESLELLFSRSQVKRDGGSEADGTELVSRLGYVALAVDLAAALIGTADVRLGNYMHRLEICQDLVEDICQDLGSSESGVTEIDRYLTVATFATCEMTITHIDNGGKTGNIEKKLFTALTCLDSKEIGEELLQNQWKDNVSSSSLTRDGSWDSGMFGSVVANLNALALVTVRHDETGRLLFALHSVIREWTKLRLRQGGEKVNFPYERGKNRGSIEERTV